MSVFIRNAVNSPSRNLSDVLIILSFKKFYLYFEESISVLVLKELKLDLIWFYCEDRLV